MRTGGDDIAQALALLGVRPVWETASGRVTGFEILPASVLDRPRVDVTLRISGFFRDAFPGLIDLFDSAVRAVAALDEPADINPLAASVHADRQQLEATGIAPDDAARRAGYRIFGSKPGAYGAGLQTLIDERIWQDESDLAGAYLGWGQWAYAAGGEGRAERQLFETARAVDDSHFDTLYEAYIGDEAVRDFMAQHNPAALAETRARFREAVERGLWRPRRNSIRSELMGGAAHE